MIVQISCHRAQGVMVQITVLECLLNCFCRPFVDVGDTD
jgi:hypothetical protein